MVLSTYILHENDDFDITMVFTYVQLATRITKYRENRRFVAKIAWN